jgi:hypothetical protein
MRLYRAALLRLYPRSFRLQYGDEMTALFRRHLREASGFASVLGVWTHAGGDVLVTAMRAHIDLLGQDLRSATRSLLRAPGFAGAAVVVAALGIGATTAALAMADHILLLAGSILPALRAVRVDPLAAVRAE